MPVTTATNRAADALAAAVESGRALPAVALTELARYAAAEPGARHRLRIALLARPELPAADAAALAAGGPDEVTVAWLVRPGHDTALLLEHLTAGWRIPQQLAAHPAATADLLTLLARHADSYTVACMVLTHPHADDAARLRALARLDEQACLTRMLHRTDTNFGQFSAAVAAGITGDLVAPAVRQLRNPALLSALAGQPMPTAAHGRLIDVCLAEHLAAAGRQHSASLLYRVLVGLAEHATEPARRRALAVLAEHGVSSLHGQRVAELLRLSTAAAPGAAGRPWSALTRAAAATGPDTTTAAAATAAALAEVLGAGLGDDHSAWRAALVLGEEFDGTLGELIGTARGIAGPPAS